MKKQETIQTITDFEANRLMAAKIIDTINSGDITEWRRTWQTFSDPVILFTKVTSGELAVNLFDFKILNNYLSTFELFQTIPAGFYITFSQIKNFNFKLKKGSKGFKTFAPKFIYKKFNKEQYRIIETNYTEQLANIRAIHGANFKATINDSEYLIVWDFINNDIAYNMALYVLTYQFNINDLEQPINVAQLWKIENELNTPLNLNNRIAQIEKIKNNYIKKAKLKFEETMQNKAFYKPSTHEVSMPELAQFGSSETYYQVLFHELSHSTGHPSLLNRQTLSPCSFRSKKSYAKEELIAELSSLFILENLEILDEKIFQNTCAYLKSWGEQLKQKIEHNILNSYFHAMKATNLILDKKEKIKGLN